MENVSLFNLPEKEKTRVQYAYRLETRRIRETDFPYNPTQTMANPGKIYDFSKKALENSDIEKLLVLYFNSGGNLIGFYAMDGTVNMAPIYIRDIIKHGLMVGAVSLAMVHNHPSGNPVPSPKDIQSTLDVSKACDLFEIRLVDHVIIGADGQFCSMALSMKAATEREEAQAKK